MICRHVSSGVRQIKEYDVAPFHGFFDGRDEITHVPLARAAPSAPDVGIDHLAAIGGEDALQNFVPVGQSGHDVVAFQRTLVVEGRLQLAGIEVLPPGDGLAQHGSLDMRHGFAHQRVRKGGMVTFQCLPCQQGSGKVFLEAGPYGRLEEFLVS